MTARRCRHPASDLLLWWINGTLAEEEEALVRMHVEGCADCSGEVEELADVSRALAAYGLPLAGVPRRTGWRLHAAYALAASLAIPAAVGIHWLAVGSRAVGPGARVDAMGPVSLLDLGEGAARGDEEPRTIGVPVGVEGIVISLLLPIHEGSR